MKRTPSVTNISTPARTPRRRAPVNDQSRRGKPVKPFQVSFIEAVRKGEFCQDIEAWKLQFHGSGFNFSIKIENAIKVDHEVHGSYFGYLRGR